MSEEQPLSAPLAQSASIAPSAESAPGLSQAARLVDAIIAPSETFKDIRRNASWWAPLLFALLVGLAFNVTAVRQIGYSKLADGVIAQSAGLQERIDSATPAQAAQIHASVEGQFKYISHLSPIFVLLIALLSAAVLMATVNFGLGGQMKFGEMMAVWFYGTLPMCFIYLLATIAIFAGLGVDNFNMQSPIGSNVAYYMPADSPKWLKHLLDSADIFAIWSACLLTLGISIVGKVKRGAAAAAVFGWWILYILLIKVALGSLGG